MNDANDEQQNALMAQLLLALQEEDDNPYDVSDEMLVAFCEGKLSGAEAEVVQRCLANNPDALSASIVLTQSAIAAASRPSLKGDRSIIRRFMVWVRQHKVFSAVGAGSALASAMALVLLVSGNLYDDLDGEFEHMAQGQDKPAISWGQGLPGRGFYPAGTFQAKGAEDDFLLQGYQQGVAEAMRQFTTLSNAQQQRLSELPPLTPHCNNVLPLSRCREVLKQGRYLGKWLAMNYVQCQLPADSADAVPSSHFLDRLQSLIEDANLGLEHPLTQPLAALKTAPADKSCGLISAMIEGTELVK